MDMQDFRDECGSLLNPEPDEDGFVPHEYPHSRLQSVHKLDFSHFKDRSDWEGASTHPYTRLCLKDNSTIRALTRNQDVPERLFETALRLFADSIIAYHGRDQREGDLHYYPPVILTFWSGFETFVRRSSELMIATVRDVPNPIANFLQEQEFVVDTRGTVALRPRFRPVLDRYAILLARGYKWQVDRGSHFWKNLIAAKELRDYYTHLDITEPRAITSGEVLQYMEAILLAIIWPSSVLKRTLLTGVFGVYAFWELMTRYATEFRERPFFLDWHLGGPYLFHCNFEDVDATRFPNMDDENFFKRE